MTEPVHAYSPEQYSTVVDLWTRLLECAGDSSFGEEDLHTLILSDGDVDWRHAEKEIKLCYSSDHAGSEYDRANARTLANEFSHFVGHLDNWGAWSESYVYLTVGELPSEDTEEGINELQRLVETVESLSDYPILNESDLYELEAEIEEESWNAWFHSDLASAVAENLGCDTYELEFDFEVSDDELKDMFYDVYSDMWDLGFKLENATTGYFEGWEDIVAPKVAEQIIAIWRSVAIDPNQMTLI